MLGAGSLPSDWVDILMYGAIGVVVLIGLIIASMAVRKNVSGTALVLAIIGIVAAVGVFAITVFADQPGQ